MFIKGDDIPPTAMYVGPPDGKSMKVSEVDGRTDSYMNHNPKPSIEDKFLASLVAPSAAAVAFSLRTALHPLRAVSLLFDLTSCSPCFGV